MDIFLPNDINLLCAVYWGNLMAKESKFAEIHRTTFQGVGREDWFWCVINRSKNYDQLYRKYLYLEGKVLVQMLTENSNISCLHPVFWGPNEQTKAPLPLFFCSFPKAGYIIYSQKRIYMRITKMLYPSGRDWIHPANLSTSKNTKVYFLLTLLIYLWFAGPSLRNQPSPWTLLVSLRDKLGTLKAGVGKHIL